jgi:hypothetical protein
MSVASWLKPFFVVVLAAALLREVLSTVSYLITGLVAVWNMAFASGNGPVYVRVCGGHGWKGYFWSRIGIASGFVAPLLPGDPGLMERGMRGAY